MRKCPDTFYGVGLTSMCDFFYYTPNLRFEYNLWDRQSVMELFVRAVWGVSMYLAGTSSTLFLDNFKCVSHDFLPQFITK